jgi:hypothetical protein
MTSNLTAMIACNNSQREQFGEDEFRIKCVVIANWTVTKNNFSFPTDLCLSVCIYGMRRNNFVSTLTK